MLFPFRYAGITIAKPRRGLPQGARMVFVAWTLPVWEPNGIEMARICECVNSQLSDQQCSR